MNKAQLVILKNEITTDPLTRGYSGMTDQEIADDVNTEYRSMQLQSMTASEILNNTDKAEYDALIAASKDIYWNLLHMGELNPWGIEADIMVDLFGGGSTTISNLQASRSQPQSRTRELGLPVMCSGFVKDAKAL